MEHPAVARELLKFPPTAKEALTEALDAHPIVFAGHSAQSLPFWLERWLEQWAKYRRVKDAALAVVGAGSSEVPSSASCQTMNQFQTMLNVTNRNSDAVDVYP